MITIPNNFHIDGEEIRSAVDYTGLVEALDQMHRENAADIRDLMLSETSNDNHTNRLLVRAGWQPGFALGVKMATIFPANRVAGLPAIHAGYILFDGTTGYPMASIDGNELTRRKTAADSALGSMRLARQDCRVLLMVGAGAMAPHLIIAHCAVRPSIEEVRVWNRSKEHRDQLIDNLQTEINITAVNNLESEVAEADLISCATMSNEQVIHGEWLQPGCHLDLVGAFTADMREADDNVMRRGRLFVDSRKTTIGEIGELVIPMNNGTLVEDDILADHYQLSRCEHPGRRNPDEITVFKNGGGGHLDLMTARHIYAACRGPR
jgi:ornithine cyclodeaminase